MAIPQTKDELLIAIDQSFQKLEETIDQISEDCVWESTLDGHVAGTKMNVANLLSYLIGWNELVLKWLSMKDAGLHVNFPDTGYNWNELGKLAQKFYQDYKGLSFFELRMRLRDAKKQIVLEIEGRSNDTLYGCSWYKNWTMGRMIQFNTSSPYENARKRLRRWIKERIS